jgi:hypothetical protein
MSEQEIVPDALVEAAEAFVLRVEGGTIRSNRSYQAFKDALTLPRTTIEEAEARGAAKERERLAVELEGNATRYPAWIVWDVPDPMSGPVNMLAADWLRAQGGDNAG